MAMDHILLIGAHWILRQGVKQTLKRLGLTIAGEGDDIDDAWSERPGLTRPDIVLVIAGHAGRFRTALETVYEAKKRFADAKFAILGEAASAEDVSAAIRAGADALLTSTLPSRLLGNSLQLVLLGHKLFPTLPVQRSSEEQGVLNEPVPIPALPLPPSTLPDLAGHPSAVTYCVIRLGDHVPSSLPQGLSESLGWSDGRTGFRGAIHDDIAAADPKPVLIPVRLRGKYSGVCTKVLQAGAR